MFGIVSNVLYWYCDNKSLNLFRCPHCSFRHVASEYMDQHLRKKHDMWVCKLCDHVEANKKDYQHHITELCKGRLKCLECPFSTRRQDIYDKHLLSHLNKPDGEELFNCKFCSFKSYSRTSMKVHEDRHNGAIPERKCQYCDFKTFNYSYLKIHEKKHTGDLKYKCDLCDFKAQTRTTLEKHTRSHTKEKLWCDQCEYGTTCIYSLNQHTRKKHSDGLNKCRYCKHIAAHSYNLYRHMVKVHPEKKVHCDQCTFEAYLDDVLAAHKKTHDQVASENYEAASEHYEVPSEHNEVASENELVISEHDAGPTPLQGSIPCPL